MFENRITEFSTSSTFFRGHNFLSQIRIWLGGAEVFEFCNELKK